MNRTATKLAIAVLTAAPIAGTPAARAQFSLPGGLGSGRSLPSLPGGLSGLTSHLGSASTGNVTGLLGYCVKNKIGNAASADGVLSKLNGRSDVAQSPDYQAGLDGKLLGGNSAGTSTSNGDAAGALGGLTSGGASKPLSLDSLPSSVKTKACDAVLKHAKSLL